MSKVIQALVSKHSLSVILFGYSYVSKAKMRKHGGKHFQGFRITKQVLELHSYGCFKGLPLYKFSEASTMTQAMANFVLTDKKFHDLTDEERCLVNVESAKLIGVKYFDFLKGEFISVDVGAVHRNSRRLQENNCASIRRHLSSSSSFNHLDVLARMQKPNEISLVVRPTLRGRWIKSS
ncbi:hypothetical protein LWI29_024702 [Acer saccharum]|uniref:Uncharacterized protein n=1 Tax=Acer saccharum TaxID=4024 RepID=A0AA39S976_ACESA|nr:hypothetical protein LWI29_024702 [Acer saccharum]